MAGGHRQGNKDNNEKGGNRKKSSDNAASSAEAASHSEENDPSSDPVTLESIQQSIAALHQKLDSQQRIQKKSDSNIQSNKALIENLQKECADRKKENKQLQSDVEMLKSIVAKQADDIKLLKQDLAGQKMRSMSNNVLFHGIPEARNESCITKVRDILKEHKFTDHYVIDIAHRIGPYNAKADRPRAIVALLGSRSQTEALLKFAAQKKDVLKVTPQHPPEIRETRKQLAEIATIARSKGADVKTKIVQDVLYVNGERHREELPCPMPRDILQMSMEDRQKALQSLRSFKTKSAHEGGSKFTAYAASAKNIEECRQLYKTLLCDPATLRATHNTAAYRLYSPLGAKTHEGFNDDGEWGMGRAVKDTLHENNAKNVIVFVSRVYGGTHLGVRRFAVVKELVKKVLQELAD